MTAKRIFNRQERLAMNRKPCGLEEVRRVRISAERFNELQAASGPVHFSGDLAALNRAIEGRSADAPIEFIATDDATGTRYLVNTEGFNYARYIGVVAVEEGA